MLDSRRHLLLVLVAVTFAGNACAVLEDRSLYFSLMVSTAPGLNTAVVAPAVELTLENINSDPTMLPGYTLHYTRVADTKVSTMNCCLKVYSLSHSAVILRSAIVQGLYSSFTKSYSVTRLYYQ